MVNSLLTLRPLEDLKPLVHILFTELRQESCSMARQQYHIIYGICYRNVENRLS
jgi:hypothetical protein